jgi:hypothetical protein
MSLRVQIPPSTICSDSFILATKCEAKFETNTKKKEEEITF